MSFRHNTTYINLVTEGSVGAILELALVVCGVADSEASQGCGEVPLGRTIIQTETPTATWKHREFINIYVKLDVFHTETGCDWPPSCFPLNFSFVFVELLPSQCKFSIFRHLCCHSKSSEFHSHCVCFSGFLSSVKSATFIHVL